MNALRALKAPHPTSSPEAWRSGHAKRHSNYAAVGPIAESYVWDPDHTIGRICHVAAKCTPFLSPAQRSVLSYLAESLNFDELTRRNNPCAWHSTSYIAHMLDMAGRTVRDALTKLEAKGLIWRSYSKDNRNLEKKAWSLAPFLMRLKEFEVATKDRADAFRAEREASKRDALEDIAAQAANDSRLNSPKTNEVSSVCGSVAPTARSLVDGRQASPADDARPTANNLRTFPLRQRQQGSPRGSVRSGGDTPEASVGAKALTEQLAAAVEACPVLQGYLSPQVIADPSSATPEDFERIADAARDLLPYSERNNDDTARAGLQRHGLLTAVMLAVALLPGVRSANAYFGGLVKRDPSGSLDFSLNFKRLGQSRAAKEEPPASATAAPSPKPRRGKAAPALPAPASPIPGVPFHMVGPDSEDPTWLAILAELRKHVSADHLFSYFGSIGFHGIIGGVLRLSAPATPAERLVKNRYDRTISDAAEAAGFPVDVVKIRARTSICPVPWA